MYKQSKSNLISESINSDVSEKAPPPISGGLFSPTSDCSSDFSQPTSLTDSMAMVNKILADGNLDRLESYLHKHQCHKS